MSHFLVLVIGDNPDAQLAPYHEFECTGVDDQYVKDVDITDQAMVEYQSREETRYRNEETGELHERVGDLFWRDATPEEDEIIRSYSPLGGGERTISQYRVSHSNGVRTTKIFEVPDGFTKCEVPATELQTFPEFVEDYYEYKLISPESVLDGTTLPEEFKYGYVKQNGDGSHTVIKRTNPNAKWDWYQNGGRFSGFLPLRDGHHGNVGERSWTNVNADIEGVDSALKEAVDFDSYKAKLLKEFAEKYDDAIEKLNGIHESLKPLREFEKNSDNGREAYKEFMTQENFTEVSAILRDYEVYYVEDFLSMDRDTYLENRVNVCVVPYAYVYQGKWYGKGEMGWFGMSHDEVDQDVWNKQYFELLDSLPDDTLLTVIDCHI